MPDEPEQPEQKERPEPSGRARLLEGMRRPWSRGQAVAALLLAGLGFAAVVQLQQRGGPDEFTGARQADLIAAINTLTQATERAEQEIADLQETRDSLQNDTEGRLTALQRAREQADVLGILAGTLPAVGPGVRITVEAEPGTVGTDQMLNGIQELRDAGAEAMEVNDSVRVVAQTALVDTENGGISFGGTDLEPPYVIDAIGDPDTLAAALSFPGGFIAEIEQVGGNVKVRKSNSVEIASTYKVPEPKYAEPVPQE